MTFRVGQKVVCVDDSDIFGSFSQYREADYRKGAIYTVSGFGEHCDYPGLPGIFLEEIYRPSNQAIFAGRFRPVVERKTDISIFTKMLTGNRVDA